MPDQTQSVLPVPQNVASEAQTNSIRREALRGAKYGALVSGSIVTVIMLIMGAFAAVVYLSASPDARTKFPLSLVKVVQGIVGVIAGIGMFSIYGAAIGATIMGLAALVRRCRGT